MSHALVAYIALVVGVALCLVGVAAGYAAHQQVQAAADMSALAGARYSALNQWVSQGERPCEIATEVAEANNVAIADCYTAHADIYVSVVRGTMIVGIPLSIHGRARAGPQD